MKINAIALSVLLAVSFIQAARAQIVNAYGRKNVSLNGEWHAIVDPFDRGKSAGIWKNHKPQGDKEFREYSFDEGLILNVPGDFNSQMPELKFYEGPVWYGRYFDAPVGEAGDRTLLYFGAVANAADVYLNGEHIVAHEGGFTPFQTDVTARLRDRDNFIAVYVDNRRRADAIPAMNFDWWNYGGITRDVMLITVPDTYISDYFVRLDKESADVINVEVALSEAGSGENVTFEIPELKVKQNLVTDASGRASGTVKVKKLIRWDVDNPKLYDVRFISGRDTVDEQIGFRNIRTEGSEIMLNDRPLFLCGVNLHEEIPQRKGRAFSEADAMMLLGEAKALGCNFIRPAHYPHNEHLVRMAERMGFLLWEEIPVWQNIDFANPATLEKGVTIMEEMVNRDKNRAAVGIWSVANETWPSAARNGFLSALRDAALAIDDTRLIGAAFNNSSYDAMTHTWTIDNDSAVGLMDVVGINKYIGWYNDWQTTPDSTTWRVGDGKPLIISEFGCEALAGHHGPGQAKQEWSEEYQARVYNDNLKMFEAIPNLAGVCPWVLLDFRSPTRMSPLQGLEFNRKGLVSDRGHRKKAWYVMRDYYSGKNKERR